MGNERLDGYGRFIRGTVAAVCMAMGLVAGAAESFEFGDWKVTGWQGGFTLSLSLIHI